MAVATLPLKTSNYIAAIYCSVKFLSGSSPINFENKSGPELIQEVEKANRIWNYVRWCNLISVFFLIALAFNDSLRLYLLLGDIPLYVFGVLGGSVAGWLIRDWNGSKELKLLNCFVKLHKKEVRET